MVESKRCLVRATYCGSNFHRGDMLPKRPQASNSNSMCKQGWHWVGRLSGRWPKYYGYFNNKKKSEGSLKLKLAYLFELNIKVTQYLGQGICWTKQHCHTKSRKHCVAQTGMKDLAEESLLAFYYCWLQNTTFFVAVEGALSKQNCVRLQTQLVDLISAAWEIITHTRSMQVWQHVS